MFQKYDEKLHLLILIGNIIGEIYHYILEVKSQVNIIK